MSSKALFASPAEVKKKSIIDGNVDDDKITQFIEVAQDTHVHNYLGTNLYEHLQGLITGGTLDDVGNAAYKTLLVSYVKPMLIWWAQVSYLPMAMFQVQNGGVYKHNSENGTSVTLEEMRSIQSEVKNYATHYTDRFIEYVCANESSFPEYNQTSSNSDYYPDGDVSYQGGWVI